MFYKYTSPIAFFMIHTTILVACTLFHKEEDATVNFIKRHQQFTTTTTTMNGSMIIVKDGG